MGFLNPLFFSLTFFIGAFILLYFFRKQFETKIIPSNMLWEQVMKEWETHPWFDRLQKNILFWLQLFALVLLMFALVRPFWHGEGVRGEDLIFVVDSSASMTAKTNGLSLFDVHKNSMKEIVAELNSEKVTIVTAGERPEVILRSSRIKNEINAKIDQLEISYQHENLQLALQMATSLAKESTAIHLFSDAVEEEAVSEFVTNHYIEVHNNAEVLENVSLKTFGVGYRDEGIGGIAVIENQNKEKVDVPFKVMSDNEVLFEETYSMEAGEEQIVFIEDLVVKDYYQAEITISDQYSLDNVQTTIHLNESPTIYAVGGVNSFLVRGLESIGVDVIQLTKADINLIEGEGIILTEDKSLLETPHHPIIYTEQAENESVELTGSITQEKDPLLEYVNMANVFVQRAVIQEIAGLETLAKKGETPLIQKGIINSSPVVAVRFSISHSDWPLHANFPIFLFNSYHWILHQANFLGVFQPGEERWVNLGIGTNTVEVFNDNDENLYSVDVSESAFLAPRKPGLYQALSGDEVYYFAVVLDERERFVASAENYILNEESLAVDEGHTDAINDQLWFWLALCALIIMTVEWEVYRRYASV